MNEKEVRKACNEARKFSPRPSTWGFFSYGHAPAAIGGGMGSFLWFPSRTALLDFIAKYLTYLAPGPANEDHEAVANSVSLIVKRLKKKEIDDLSAKRSLNAKLKNYSQIEWIGTLHNLLEGRGDFPRKIRSWFRENESGSEEPSASAISAADRGKFVKALKEYGI
jgi:hypothetical protein